MKPKVLGIGSKENYAHFTLEKKQSTLEILVKLLKDELKIEVYTLMFEHEGAKVKASKLVDKCYNFISLGINIELIFGKNKVFMICNGTTKKINIIKKFISKNFGFVNPKIFSKKWRK